MKIKALLAALLLLAAPALAGSWSQPKLRPGGTSVFTVQTTDSGDQPRLDMTECFAKPEISVAVSRGPTSIDLFLAWNGTNASTNATKAANITASGQYSTIEAGNYFLLPKVVTPPRDPGTQITVRCANVAPMNAVRAGNRWIAGTELERPLAYLRREPVNNEIGGSKGSYGYDYFFDDFNESHSFTVSGNNAFGAQSGVTLVAEAQPHVTAAANATSPNTNQVWRWWRTDIGSPTNFKFYSYRSTGLSNELHSSVVIGNAAGDTSDGFIVYNPFISWGTSGSSQRKQGGFAYRVAKVPTNRQVGTGFYGIANAVTGVGTPLLTTGALSTAVADVYYAGFYVDASDNIFFAVGNSNVSAFSFDTGFNLGNPFTTLEVRAKIFDGGGGWGGESYFDCFVNGIPVVPAAGRKHCVEVSDIAWAPGLNPQNLTFGYVHTTGGNTESFRIDYAGMWHDRLIGEE